MGYHKKGAFHTVCEFLAPIGRNLLSCRYLRRGLTGMSDLVESAFLNEAFTFRFFRISIVEDGASSRVARTVTTTFHHRHRRRGGRRPGVASPARRLPRCIMTVGPKMTPFH
jgi:hypothetical protein